MGNDEENDDSSKIKDSEYKIKVIHLFIHSLNLY